MPAIELHVLSAAAQAWGDYGYVLANGLADDSHAEGLRLERTGPFVPPMTFPWPHIVVTDDFKNELEPEAFDGISFREVVKRKIVHLDWQLWDKELSAPPQYPRGGEPENYIRRGRHDADVAAQIGTMWNLVVPVRPGLQIEGGAIVDISHYDGLDICCGSRFGYTFVSERLRRFLESRVGEWVNITPARVVHGA
jgi:hypothetical protein